MLKMDENQRLTEKFNRFFPGGHIHFRVPVEEAQNRIFITRAAVLPVVGRDRLSCSVVCGSGTGCTAEGFSSGQ
jgi:hypothetical protein